MASDNRRHYIDNLRWLTLMLLIPYHAAMAWNSWGEPNYVYFEGNRTISSIVVFFSPYFMPLMFVLAGVSTKYALKKRTYTQYLAERAKRLLVPLLSGTLLLMPVMSYLADCFNCGYDGGFFEHYGIFFTRFTDLTGADGGFSIGQFWFLLYLFVISALSVPVLRLFGRKAPRERKSLPFPLLLACGLPLPLLDGLLSVGGKSIAGYTYLFLLGYFLFSDDSIVEKAEKHCLPMLAAGICAAALNVWLFLWSEQDYPLLNTAAKYAAGWFMIVALTGVSKRYLDTAGKVSAYMSRISFLYYFWHFIWVILSSFLLYRICADNTAVLYAGTVLLSAAATLFCCDISIRIPFVCFLTGTVYRASGRAKDNNADHR